MQPAVTPAEKAAQLQNARIDGREQYLAFRALVCPAYEMFKTLFAPKMRPDNANLEPDPTCCPSELRQPNSNLALDTTC